MKDFAARTAFAAWVAISLLVGVTFGVLRLTNVPGEGPLDGDEVIVCATVCVCWSLLTFICGTPLVWVAVALRTRIRARRARRAPARDTHQRTATL